MSELTFYSDPPDGVLRQGDVLLGVPALEHVVEKLNPAQNDEFSVAVRTTSYSVIMSPCCSIKEGMILLCPLQQIRANFFTNPYLTEDFSRLNRRMTPEQSMSPGKWQKLTDKERSSREAEGVTYAFLEVFVYAPAQQLSEYQLEWKDEKQRVGHYMIDFRNTYKVRCPEIQHERTVKSAPKILQLSPHSRQDLRKKLSFYYGRMAQEDSPFVES